MSKPAQQSILTTIAAYIGVLIGYVNLLWLMPYVLEPEQIGLFKTIQDMALLLVPFAQMGIGNGITRFFPRIKHQKYAFFSFSLFLGMLGYALVVIIFLLFKNPIMTSFSDKAPEVNNFLQVALIITFFSVINTLLDAFSRSFLKIAIPSLIRDVLLRLLMALLVIGYYLAFYPFHFMIWGMGGVYLLAMLAMAGYMVHIGIFHFDFRWKGIPGSFRKEFIQYNTITLLGTAGALLIMKIDSLMVSSMIGLDANAIYTIGFSIAVVIEMPRRAISQVAMPLISEKFAANLLDEIDVLYKKIAVHQLLICLLIFLLIWVNIDTLYHFVPNKEVYQAGKWVVLLIGLGKLTDILFSVNGEIIVFSKFYVFNITATLLMCAAVILFNLALIPAFGIEGAALASLLAMFFYNLLKFFFVKIRLGFNPFTKGIFTILFTGGISWAVSFYLIPVFEPVLLDLLVRSSMVSLLYLALIYWLKAAPEAMDLVINKIKSIFYGRIN
ncbi:oligosaccharide flippase family protein [Cyclobacterium plantarum]|uniref:Polysaccharide biosynthesis protein n=1 Tax=Cyclobacterium plantarum TaxID=2716263 RepID=A0ABX0H2L3_9BACT|nr:oligosaccharide flippase family protein [Cyclobacterium plantarum]NHE55869.1 polysaccharide biosynthesis protein [Cyclobacterium plantarum]